MHEAHDDPMLKKTFAALTTTIVLTAAVPVADASVPARTSGSGTTVPLISTDNPQYRAASVNTLVAPLPLPAKRGAV